MVLFSTSPSASLPSLHTAVRWAVRIAPTRSRSTREEVSLTETWARVFAEAAALGVLQVHLSGGEPGARRDLVAIMAAAHAAGLYTNLITSAVGIALGTFRQLAEAGLDHVQISIQDSERASADRIAGYDGAFARKCALAAEVVHLKIPLTVNAVMHRANIDHIEDMVALALALGASRVEIAHVQYYGWALKNRAALMPSAEQVKRAAATVEELRHRHHGKIVIDAVVPGYYARFPKPCVGGWGRRSLNVTPAGKVLPCHAAESIPGLEFWSVREHSLADIWANSPAFNAFRGTAWMQEPCASCARRDVDFGGCRCQAFALTGDARATDPVCHLAPRHEDVAALAAVQHDASYAYRRMWFRRLRLPRYWPWKPYPIAVHTQIGRADPPLSSPLFDNSSEADQSVVRFPVQVIHGNGLGAHQSRLILFQMTNPGLILFQMMSA